MEAVIFIGGAIVVIWQVGRQLKNNLKLQREDYKEKLRIKVHQEIMSQITETENQTIVVPIFQAIQNIEYYRKSVVSNPHTLPPNDRALNIQTEFFSFLKEVNKLGTLLDRYEITFPSSRIFRMALSASSSDAQDAFLNLYSLLLKLLPTDIPENYPPLPNGSRLMIPELPTDKEFVELKELGKKAIDEIDGTFNYIFDLNVEIQNITFSHLFKAEVPIREPLDPNSIVISSKNNNFDELKRYFEENTNWGKRQKEAEEDIRKLFKNKE